MAKIGGLILCIAGVAVLAFYKGPYLKPLFKFHLFQTQQSHVSSKKEWILGCFLLFLTCLTWGLWYVLQVINFQYYPEFYMLFRLLFYE